VPVGVLIVAHQGVGPALLDTAVRIYGRSPLPARTVDVPADGDPNAALGQALCAWDQLDGEAGVLVLSDLPGSTPANVAERVARQGRTRVVSGLNLPMLVRVFNYPDLDLEELARKALEGGRDGVRLRGEP
jgi:PTS system ascorbate-specific IIA component